MADQTGVAGSDPRQRILRATFKVLCRHGYGKFNLSDVAAQAGDLTSDPLQVPLSRPRTNCWPPSASSSCNWYARTWPGAVRRSQGAANGSMRFCSS